MLDLSALPIVDHHAHPLQRAEATRDAGQFRSWFTESTAPEIHARHVPHSLFFQTALTWLAELLNCEPVLETVLMARAAQSYEAWTRRLFNEAKIELLLCDYGYQGEHGYDHAGMQALLPCPVRPILRLETLAQDLLMAHHTFAAWEEAFVSTLRQAGADGYVAFKSIIAYRTGLAVEAPSRPAAAAAFAEIRATAGPDGRIRLADKAFCDYLLGLAVVEAERQALPIQFHTGFGDSDADLLWANPLHLRPLIEQVRCPLILLHAGWPFYRELAHLAAIYPNVWLDLSLAIPFATTGIPTMLRDVLGMAPFSKVMFATDAFTMPEIFWLAARWGRWGLGRVLAEFIADGFLSEQAAWAAAEAILGGNARQVYSL
jgi:hypothetical protein